MRMSFDINEAVFDEQGAYLEEPALRYEQALMEQFSASPEGQAITQTGTELGWAGAMIHYAITSPGATPPTMAAASGHPGPPTKKKSRTVPKDTMNPQRRKKRTPPQ